MIPLRTLAAELGRTAVALKAHYLRLGIIPTERRTGVAHGNAFLFTDEQADAIRASVNAAKRGRPPGVKDAFKRKTRCDAGKARPKGKKKSAK